MTATVATVKDIAYYEKSEMKQKKTKKGLKDTENYYSEESESIGLFCAKGAEQLGINGPIFAGEFTKLMNGIHPKTNKELWKNKVVKHKGTDITLSCPKDFTLLYVLANEETKKALIEIYNHSVNNAVNKMEELSYRNTKLGGSNKDIKVKDVNIIVARFGHQTARPVANQRPDPQLHEHTIQFRYALNDKGEVYTADNYLLFKNQQLIGTKFRADLSNGLKKLGMGIIPSREEFFDDDLDIDFKNPKIIKAMQVMKMNEEEYKNHSIFKTKTKLKSFKVVGITEELRTNFSRRSVEINKIAKEIGAVTTLDKQNITTKSKRSKILWDKEELQMQWKMEGEHFGFTEDKIEDLKHGNEVYANYGKSTVAYIIKQSLTKDGILYEGKLKLKLAEDEQFSGKDYDLTLKEWKAKGIIEVIEGYKLKCNIDLTEADKHQKQLNSKKKVCFL